MNTKKNQRYINEMIDFIKYEVHAVHGNTDFLIDDFSAFGQETKNKLVFIKDTNRLVNASLSKNCAYIIPNAINEQMRQNALDSGSCLIEVEKPRFIFIKLLEQFFKKTKPVGVHHTAIISDDFVMGNNCYIGPYSVIGPNCSIGDNVQVNAHVHMYENVKIGNDVIIHSHVVIGKDGFGYERDSAGKFNRFPHYGGVIIEDDVEVGSGTCIDRGTLGYTKINRGVKIDNLVHIAHNVQIGEDSGVVANVLIGGSTIIGQRSWFGPSATVRDALTIGDDTTIGMCSNVIKNVQDGTVIAGNPGRPLDEQKLILSAIKKLVDEGN